MPSIGREQRHFWLLTSLLLVFGAVFVVRGPMRAIDGGEDLAHLYIASVLWLEGGNPYDGAQCVQAMQQAGYDDPAHVASGSFYPPTTIAVLSPLGLMGWEAARLAWLAVNLACCGVLVWALAAWLNIASTWRRWMVALLVLLAWGPAMTSLSLGQLSITAAACLFAGFVLIEKRKIILPGLLIAAGCLIKPQLGLGFLLLLGLRRDWRVLGIAVVAILLLTSIGIGRLMQNTPDWPSTLAGNLSAGDTPGGMLDASLAGPLRYQMCDLRPLLHLVLPAKWINLAALTLVATLAAVAIAKLVRVGVRRHTLLAVSGIGLLVLLPVYHRVYDAMLLLPLLVFVLNQLMRDGRDRLMILIGLLVLPLFLPLPSMFILMHGKGVVPDVVHSSWPWQHLVLQHQSWCLLIASLALVVWTCRLSLKGDDLALTRQSTQQGAAK